MTSLGELKVYFNTLIDKHKKAMNYLENPNVSNDKKEQWLESGKYEELTIELSLIMEEYNRLIRETTGSD